MSQPRFDGQVAVVTGAGWGMGRAHARVLASRDALVVLNDLGTSVAGDGASLDPAQEVVTEIEQGGGTAVASTHSVSTTDGAGDHRDRS